MPDPVTQDDIILDILMSVRDEQRASVSPKLLREVYDLQRRYQFEIERDQAILGVKRAVEAEAERLMAEGDGQ